MFLYFAVMIVSFGVGDYYRDGTITFYEACGMYLLLFLILIAYEYFSRLLAKRSRAK